MTNICYLVDSGKVADNKGHEVGAHLDGLLELVPDEVGLVAHLGGALLGHVEEGAQRAVVRDRHEELGLELGLVEAGEGAAGVCRLEVRRRQESVVNEESQFLSFTVHTLCGP